MSHAKPERRIIPDTNRKRHPHVRMAADISQEPERLHVTERVDDKDVAQTPSRALQAATR